jgi:hypothetical protein
MLIAVRSQAIFAAENPAGRGCLLKQMCNAGWV